MAGTNLEEFLSEISRFTYGPHITYILSDGIRWNKFIMHIMQLQMWADLEIPDKKGFCGDKHDGPPRQRFDGS